MFSLLQSRTLKVTCKALPTWGGQDVLVAQSVTGTEALGELFEYKLELASLVSPTFHVYKTRELIKPDELIGKCIEISIEFEGKGTFVPGLPGNLGAGNVGAGIRTIEGIIMEVQQTGNDERRAHYRFTVRPWLWLATQNRDNRVFQDMSVLEITENVLNGGNYKFPLELRLAAVALNNNVFPKRDFIRQFWQSDYEFLSQIWSEWGIYYHFDGMTLVLCDSPGSHKKHGNAYDTILYHPSGNGRIDEEHIHSLRVSRQITAGDVTLNDYDYTQSNGTFLVNQYRHSKSARDNIEQYHWGDYTQPLAGAMGLSGRPNDLHNEGDYLAWVRVEALRCEGLRAHGAGNLRGMKTGRTFRMEGHPQKEINQKYLVVSTSIDVRNPDELTVSTGGDALYHCKIEFVVQPGNAFFKIMPKRKPRAHPETAVVTGPPNEPLWLDAYGRIRCQFKWDRLGKKDQNSSCWIRVSLPWHGGPHSFVAVPRVGDEITIGYHEGDPDKPFVLSSKVNQFNPPPFDLPKNMALTGLVSHALEGQGHNYLVTDDTPRKQQVQVASDQANSRLVLGYNTRIVYGNGRQQARGLGWELATDAWGVLRANKGMLISTEARSGASAPVKDMGETVARLTQARGQHEELTSLAQRHEAQTTEASQSDVVRTIKAQNEAIKGGPKTPDDPSPEMTRPDLVLTSSAGIATTAAESTHQVSGQDFAVTAGRDMSVSLGRSLLASVRGAISLFAYQLGLKLIAAKGRVEIQAQSDQMALAALKDITISSADGRIVLTASKEIWIGAGGSYIQINGSGIINGSPGAILEKGATWGKIDADSRRLQTPTLPNDNVYHEQFHLLDEDGETPLARRYYEIHSESGKIWSGYSDNHGLTERVYTDVPEELTIVIEPKEKNVGAS